MLPVTPYNFPYPEEDQTMPSMEQLRLDPVKMLLELRDSNVRMETKMDIYLGKDGIIPTLQRRVDSLNTRMLLFTGGGMVIVWLLEKIKLPM